MENIEVNVQDNPDYVQLRVRMVVVFIMDPDDMGILTNFPMRASMRCPNAMKMKKMKEKKTRMMTRTMTIPSSTCLSMRVFGILMIQMLNLT
uniref:Uncharacterized protein n=1 Tax=Bracon brevicornis TaxID=1563983 RepID=A0A6V7LME6_9HYME